MLRQKKKPVKGNNMKIREFFTALIWMSAGAGLVFTSVILMNKTLEKPLSAAIEKSVQFDVKKEEKKEKPKTPRTERKKSITKLNSTQLAPLPNIGSSIAGADFGLPQFSSSIESAVNEKILGNTDNAVMTDDSVDSPPKPSMRGGPIEYPPKARARGITGFVLFNLLITPNGDVEKAQILESVPSGVFDDAALASVTQWKFEPAMYKGKSVKVWAKQKISFNLN